MEMNESFLVIRLIENELTIYSFMEREKKISIDSYFPQDRRFTVEDR